MRIRDGRPDDLPTIREFNTCMARETEDVHLDESKLERGIRKVFDDPSTGFYLMAERDGETVGQTLVTFEWSDWRDGWFWWIQSVYVRPDARRQGVYRALHDEVEHRARNREDVCGVRLYVIRDNDTARNVYAKMGMGCTGYRLYEKEF